jgi:tetratricopeptide (TPR) repeat protein
MSVTPQPRQTAPSRRRAAFGLALLGLVLFGAGAGAWWFLHQRHGPEAGPARRGEPPPEDPRTAYAGPFLNVAPDVKYVGSAACAGCHDAKVESFRHHPMGRSMFATAAFDPPPPEDRAHHNPFEALNSQFRIGRDGGTVLHRRAAFGEAGRPVYDSALEADYAIGSGAHGISYLAVREGGYVVQTPISWYAEKQTWDLSPSFTDALATGRPVTAECLFCHANHSEPVEGTVNRYKEPVFDGLAIGCERCHGPGEKHVAARRREEPINGDFDATIVNPAHLSPALSGAVCEQCHLAGEVRVLRRGRQLNDFRPGLALEDFVTVLVRAADGGHDSKAVNHVEQMHVSRCFRESPADNKLGCVSCHDPHVQVEPARRVEHYRASCLACHAEHGCSLPRDERLKTSPQDSCVQCHMPRNPLGNIPHTAGTDHRIIRFRRAGDEPRSGPLPTGPGLPVTPFHAPPDAPPGPEVQRDVAIGLMGPLAGTGKVDPLRYSAPALRYLEEAVARDPEDWDAWQAKAQALWAQGRRSEAIAALEAVLAKAPRREMALTSAASLSQDLGQVDAAVDYWRRAVAVNPWAANYRRSLCLLLARKGAWEEMRPDAEAWLRLDPASIDARQTWVGHLLHTGHKDEAQVEFDKIQALRPANLDKVRAWYEQESK